ncbi:PTS system, mannose-specific IIA component [Atopostipes suicloacalis DSM 15692]|uniref:PTS system, mannose-specific IIA component n=2 Tax=Atopostipes TaxID=292480 RepID=A0A1M4XU61_9LACT|nr:PTS fructose transporter subunit IIA [Atopostipes suicloacalis]SHE97039.1 PTS system, mannose-specific IIA component [Atopostipes suicloacalis DSM 15692]
MKQLLLVSHGRFAEELKKSVEMILGPQENIYTVSLLPNEGEKEFTEKFDGILQQLEGEVTVFADLLGGTPANIVSKKIMKDAKMKLYSGMNMPMIISYMNALLVGEEPDVLYDAQKGIVDVNKLIVEADFDDEDE